MQSEIDDIRAALEVLHTLNDHGLMTEATCREGLCHIGCQLDLIEAQQAVHSDMVVLPVTTLATITAAAMRDRRRHMALADGGAA